MFRSHSVSRGQRASARAGRRLRASSQRPASRLRLESLEDRRLLAITPIGEFDVVTGDTVTAPEIAYNAAGDFVVVWRTIGAEGDGDGLGILAQVFDADGVAQSPQVAVNTTTAGDQTNQSVAMDADGDFVVAWESGEIMAQRFDRTGAKIGGEITVNTYTDLTQARPSVGSDGAGNFTVVWDSSGGPDFTGTGHDGGIFGRQFAPDGSAVGGEFRVDVLSAAGLAPNRPKLAMNASGEFAVTWYPTTGSNLSQTPIQWFNADRSYDGELVTHLFDLGGVGFSALNMEMDASGRVFVGVKSALGMGIGQLLSASGIVQGPLVYRGTGLGTLAMDSSGNLVWGGEAGDVFYENLLSATASPVGATMPWMRAALGDNGSIAVVGIVVTPEQPAAIHVKRFVVDASLKVTSVTTADGEFLNVTPGPSYDPDVPPRNPEPARRSVEQLIVNFSGAASTVDGVGGFHSVTNPENWQLFKDGIDISAEISQIDYAGNRATIDLYHVLPEGQYQLIARDSIEGADGQALDGNADGTAGSQYSAEFEVGPLKLLGPETFVGSGIIAATSMTDGSVVVAWIVGTAVKAQRYDGSGSPIGAMVEVGTATSAADIDIKSDGLGRWIVTWRDSTGVVFRRFGSDDLALGDKQPVTTNTILRTDFDVDSVGNFVVAWGDPTAVRFQRFDSQGLPQGSIVTVENTVALDAPGVAINDAGQVVITWSNSGSRRAQTFAADNTPISGKVIAGDSLSGGVDTPIVIDESGSFVVGRTTNLLGPQARRFDVTGTPISDEISLPGSRFAADPQGGLRVTWFDDDVYPSTSDDPALYTQRVQFTGERVGKPLRVTSAADPVASAYDMPDAGVVVFQSFLPSFTLPSVGFQRITATPPAAAVVDRRVFYNQSAFDGDDPGSGAEDDGAIAPDKVALLPGQSASLANYTSYWLGINGVMIDLAGMHGNLSLDDFSFRRGNSNDPSSWVDAPLPSQITVRAGAGVSGSDRIELIWGNGVKNQWLEVTLLANADTGLDVPDVFYFGNAIGESGNSAIDARVNTSDQLGPRNNATSNAAITNRFDYNRDGQVDTTDELLARNNPTGAGNALRLIDLGAPILVTAASSATSAGSPIASALALSTITTLDPAAHAAPLRPAEAHIEPAVARSTAAAARVDAAMSLVLESESSTIEKVGQAFEATDDWLDIELP